MKEPIEQRKEPGKYLEDRLQVKFDDLQIAREDRQADLFDEIAKSIEVLFRAVPQAHEDLQQEKDTLDEDFENELRDIELEASRARDDIHRNAILQNRGYSAQWEYREVYEEILIDVMQKHGLVPMLRSQRHQLSTAPGTIEDMQDFVAPHHVPINMRQPNEQQQLPIQQQPPQQPPQQQAPPQPQQMPPMPPQQYQQPPPQMPQQQQPQNQPNIHQFPPKEEKKKPHLTLRKRKKKEE